jgi:hypothetical protein
MDHAWAEGFIKPETRVIVQSNADPAALLDSLNPAAVPEVPRWITRGER